MRAQSFLFAFSLLISTVTWGHAHLTAPVPRSNDAGLKVGPCGGIARKTPTDVGGGQMLTVTWEESIQHPGKYLFALSKANDTGFELNPLATVIDTQDGKNDLPHKYQVQIMMPNIDCPGCTLQMIQSMEENVNSPSYYYSCADINIKLNNGLPTPTPSPGGGGETIQSSSLTAPANGVKFGQGCGTVKYASTPEPMNPYWMIAFALTMLIPILAWIRMRSVHMMSNR